MTSSAVRRSFPYESRPCSACSRWPQSCWPSASGKARARCPLRWRRLANRGPGLRLRMGPVGRHRGDGITATGLNLTVGLPTLEVAVDPRLISFGSYVHVRPNPFGPTGACYAGDAGGAITRIYDWRGRASRDTWGQCTVSVTPAPVPASARGQFDGPAARARISTSPCHCLERECPINGGCAWWVYLILPSNAIANAFSAGFHLIAQRAFPRPVGSRALVTR